MMDDVAGKASGIFLSSLQMTAEVRQLVETSSKIRIAVAYWGSGAGERVRLGNLAGRDIIIVCDLMSGACNPSEIEELWKDLGSVDNLSLHQGGLGEME
jgi:hypothetical protein